MILAGPGRAAPVRTRCVCVWTAQLGAKRHTWEVFRARRVLLHEQLGRMGPRALREGRGRNWKSWILKLSRRTLTTPRRIRGNEGRGDMWGIGRRGRGKGKGRGRRGEGRGGRGGERQRRVEGDLPAARYRRPLSVWCVDGSTVPTRVRV